MRERDLFIAALELESPTERAALLDEACRTDAPLRAQVEQRFLKVAIPNRAAQEVLPGHGVHRGSAT